MFVVTEAPVAEVTGAGGITERQGKGMGLVSATVAERDDQDLVADVRSGDDRAFEALYTRYRRRIAAYVQGMVGDHARAEDITQEVFISALRRMRETERAIAFKPWIYEIAKNACIDSYRRSRRAEEVSLDADGGLAPADYGRLTGPDQSPETAVEGKQKLGDLCSAFGGLSETHHEILVLREFEGLSYREIGERMGLSRPSVESTLFRARRRLTEEYDDLASGRRCQRIQAMIDDAAAAPLGVRDRRRMARHVSCCQSCRRQARLAGLDQLDVGRGLAARVAAVLPFPFLLRRVRGHGADAASSAGGHAGTSLAQFATGLAPAADQVGGWSKAAIVAVSVAVAGAGAGAATQATSSSSSGSHRTAAPLVKPAVPLATGRGAHLTPARSSAASSAARHRGRVVGARVGAANRAASKPAKRPPAVGDASHATGTGSTATQSTGSSSTGNGHSSLLGLGGKGSLPHVVKTSGSTGHGLLPNGTPQIGVLLSPDTQKALQKSVTETASGVAGAVGTTTQAVGGLLGGLNGH